MFEFRGERGVHVYAEAHQHHPVGPLHPGVDLSDEGGSNHRQPSYISRQVINDLIWSLDIQIFLLTILQDEERVEYEQPVLVPGARTARKVGVLLMIIYKTTRRPLFGCLFVHP